MILRLGSPVGHDSSAPPPCAPAVIVVPDPLDHLWSEWVRTNDGDASGDGFAEWALQLAPNPLSRAACAHLGIPWARVAIDSLLAVLDETWLVLEERDAAPVLDRLGIGEDEQPRPAEHAGDTGSRSSAAAELPGPTRQAIIERHDSDSMLYVLARVYARRSQTRLGIERSAQQVEQVDQVDEVDQNEQEDQG